MVMRASPLPPDGTKTICENHFILVHVDNKTDVSGEPKLLPSVLLADELPPELLPQRPPLYSPDASSDNGEDASGRAALNKLVARAVQYVESRVAPPVRARLEYVSRHPVVRFVAPLAPILQRSSQLIWSSACGFVSDCKPRSVAAPLEWHPRQPLLAAADRWGRVQVVDLGPSLRATGLDGKMLRPEVLVSGPRSLRAVLTHEALGEQVLSLSWSPTAPGLLAVGSEGVVGLWAVGGEARPPLAAAARTSGPWLRLMKTRARSARVMSLSWSPDGRLLAAASPNQSGLQIWDVATGTSVEAGPGFAAFDLVRWSPCGNYVFAAGNGSRHFYIFETQKWWWDRWDIEAGVGGTGTVAVSAAAGARGRGGKAAAAVRLPSATPASAYVVAASWAPAMADRVPILLLALYGSKKDLLAVHLVETPPGLKAQVLPVALPELQRVEAGRVGGRFSGGGVDMATAAGAGGASPPWSPTASNDSAAGGVVDMAWDSAGERLAVLLASPHEEGSHTVALYGTSMETLVKVNLIGLACPSELLCHTAVAASAASSQQLLPVSTTRPEREEQQQQQQQEAAGPPTATGVNAHEGGAPATLVALTGALTAARLVPMTCGSSNDRWPSPSCVISVRVGERGIYNLPCFL